MLKSAFRTGILMLAAASVTVTAASAGSLNLARNAFNDAVHSNKQAEVSIVDAMMSLLASGFKLATLPVDPAPPASPQAPDAKPACEMDASPPASNQTAAPPAKKRTTTTVGPEPFYLGF